ncbi:pentapeptide repeat-containing protein [Aquisalinus flavus]|uniref:Pentapeptide repeat-containing protein n=1 Tax=Aquisalinus flavus TaxID=1526572 RepID=A0A8J2Y4S1_9PROT|nr:pentapeptide repeat-containing protein [Aquisalinus flavus]MBD0427457.1 pentapeptide repeat-containing protein [Aquisalinus flavus]UNE47258.1 pentapeptide repeat-containing protein [Aquisalinus flavus]GGD01173.1 hypothetical protein GCM10011342_07700 [Aquisalinus flavus]
MIKIVILTVAVIFNTMLYSYANASLQEQQRFPKPVRTVLDTTIDTVVTGSVELNRVTRGRGLAGVWNSLTGRRIDQAPVTGLNADLSGSRFSRQLMPKSSFVNATLDRSTFSHSIMDGSMLDSAFIRQATFVQTDLKETTARGSDFSGSVFERADLGGSLMQSAIFDSADFRDTSMTGVQFSGASFRHARLTDTMAMRSVFYRADLIGLVAERVSFRRARFDEALMTGAILRETDMAGAIFTNADLSGADLSTVTGLTQEQLNSACGNSMTRLPAGLKVQECTMLSLARNKPQSGTP